MAQPFDLLIHFPKSYQLLSVCEGRILKQGRDIYMYLVQLRVCVCVRVHAYECRDQGATPGVIDFVF